MPVVGQTSQTVAEALQIFLQGAGTGARPGVLAGESLDGREMTVDDLVEFADRGSHVRGWAAESTSR